MLKSTRSNRDRLSASLLFLLIQVASARLVTTNWASYLYFSETLAALGTIIGLALGASKFERRIVITLTLAYTAVIIPWQMSAAMSDELLIDRLTHIGGILAASLNQFIQRKPVLDPLFFVAFICMMFWFISLAAGYWLVRHDNFFIATIPSFVAILIIQLYDNYRSNATWWLAIYLMILLLLLGREYYLQNQANWTQRRVFINEDSWSNIFNSLFFGVVLAVVIAWFIPTSFSSWRSAADSWTSFTKPLIDRLSNAVTSLNGNYSRPNGNYYGTTLGLGHEAGQGDSTVFTVKLLNEPNFNSRYYWRGRVYDYYKNGQWSGSPAPSFAFQPSGGDLKITDSDNRSEASLLFTIQFSTQSLVYAPAQPVWVDQPGSIIYSPTNTNLSDILSWEATTAVQSGGHYQVRSELADPNIQELRGASTQYPGWVKDRYLEIPDDVNTRIKDLAEKVSGSQNDPYDKSEAITNYLRRNIQYETSVPTPPDGQDPVLWVLFDYKKGFCNYYASSEVLMLRAVGIPARLAVGFAQGQYQNGVYNVRQRDAHAWPEVYFPSIGWVEFEPTVSQDALMRPLAPSQANSPSSAAASPPRKPIGELNGTPPDNSGQLKNIKGQPFEQTALGRFLIISSIFLAAGLAIFLLRRSHVLTYVPVYLSKSLEKNGITPPAWIEIWSRWNQLEPIERLFTSINWSLNVLGKPQPMDATPADRSRILKKLLPSAAENIDALTYEFESALFTPRIADLSRARRSSFSIVLHTLYARFRNFLDAIDDGDVYSS